MVDSVARRRPRNSTAMPKAGGKVKEAVRASAGRPSAFESLHTLRRKHSVLGKKLTHKRRTTLQARARSQLMQARERRAARSPAAVGGAALWW